MDFGKEFTSVWTHIACCSLLFYPVVGSVFFLSDVRKRAVSDKARTRKFRFVLDKVRTKFFDIFACFGTFLVVLGVFQTFSKNFRTKKKR